YDNSEAYSKLKTGLKSHINQVINEMLEQTSNRFQTVFALDDHGSSHLSFPSLVFDLTYFAIKQRKNESDEILIVDESFTSI
ncbi:transposase, partial [Staphylococcus warneri]